MDHLFTTIAIGSFTLPLISLLGYLSIKQRRKIKQLISKYGGIIDIDSEITKRRKEHESEKIQYKNKIKEAKISLDGLKKKYQAAMKAFDELIRQNNLLKDTLDIAEFGVYEPHFDLASSEQYKEKLSANKEKQKSFIRNGDAAICHTPRTLDGSRKKGEIMERKAIKLTLRAFNGECDSLVAKVKWNNIEQYEKRIEKTFDAINKINSSQDIQIKTKYLQLKIDELRLTYEFERKKYEEKEDQRRIKEQMREEEKAQRDFEKAKKEAEKEERLLHQAMKKAQEEISKASKEERERYELQLAKLNEKLKEAEEKNQRAISMAQQTKCGHVYVISNLGSFGENIYKIGMTRRLEPMDRVNELGDASVPFKFDVHAMIYSENAPELENELHKTFHHKRLNFVNLRREYFDISLEEIEKVVNENHGEIAFIKVPEAKEYRESLIIKEQMNEVQKEPELETAAYPSIAELF